MRFILSSFLGTCLAALNCLPAQALDVYFLRGAGDLSQISPDMHFSRGLDEMAEILAREGLKTKVFRFTQVNTALREIRRERPESLALVGHSMGAAMSMRIVRELRKEGVRVAYLATLDIPGPLGLVEDNVDRADNFYTVNPVFARITRASANTSIRNISMFGTIHNQMDDTALVKSNVLAVLREIHANEQRSLLNDPFVADAFNSDIGTSPKVAPEVTGQDTQTDTSAGLYGEEPLDEVSAPKPVTSPLENAAAQSASVDPLQTSTITSDPVQSDGLPQSRDPLLQQRQGQFQSTTQNQSTAGAPLPELGVGELFKAQSPQQGSQIAPSAYFAQQGEPGPQVQKWRSLFNRNGRGESR